MKGLERAPVEWRAGAVAQAARIASIIAPQRHHSVGAHSEHKFAPQQRRQVHSQRCIFGMRWLR